MKFSDIAVILATAGAVYYLFSSQRAQAKPRTVYAGLESAWDEVPGQGRLVMV